VSCHSVQALQPRHRWVGGGDGVRRQAIFISAKKPRSNGWEGNRRRVFGAVVVQSHHIQGDPLGAGPELIIMNHAVIYR
jgi:hypothetical protein